jgi:putative toxin-antitoxin system antitoxin component (TIGR02293 family)
MISMTDTVNQPRAAPRNRGTERSSGAPQRRAGTKRRMSGADSPWTRADFPLCLYRSDGPALVELVKAGVPSAFVETLTERMAIGKEKFYKMLGLARPTLDRKIRARRVLNRDESERLIGIARLIGQAEGMVEESGGLENFDAARWMAAWFDRPLPALGGRHPAEFMDTAIGRALISDILKQQQSAAYG